MRASRAIAPSGRILQVADDLRGEGAGDAHKRVWDNSDLFPSLPVDDNVVPIPEAEPMLPIIAF